jgi:hypothetical protein
MVEPHVVFAFCKLRERLRVGSTTMALEPELWIIVKPWPCSFYSEPVNGGAYSVNCELWNYVELTVRVIPWRLMNFARLYKVMLRLG